MEEMAYTGGSGQRQTRLADEEQLGLEQCCFQREKHRKNLLRFLRTLSGW